MALSKKRQRELSTPEAEVTVRALYKGAVERFGQEETDRDLTRIWDWRCILGIRRVLPFGSLPFTTMRELLWIAENVCGYGKGGNDGQGE